MAQRRQASLSAVLTGEPTRMRFSILSISLSCFAMREKTSTNCSAISGTGADGTTGALSTMCSAVCRWTRSCGLTPAKRSGRTTPVSSSTNRSKSSGWGGGGFCRRGASCLSSCPFSPLLAVVSMERRKSICSVSCSWRQC